MSCLPASEDHARGLKNGFRIIWDNEEIVKRIWDRCLKADGIADELSTYHEKWGRGYKTDWRMTKVNERMRFLRYGPGHYFKSAFPSSNLVPCTDMSLLKATATAHTRRPTGASAHSSRSSFT